HQSTHADPYGEAADEPAIASVVTPFVALIAVHRKAAMTVNQRTSPARSNVERKSTLRRRETATTASRVFPTAIAAATGIEASPLVAFAMKAPSAIAGQKRGPRRSSAASAIPVGGQTGVMTPWATESSSPTRAAPTYAATTTRNA